MEPFIRKLVNMKTSYPEYFQLSNFIIFPGKVPHSDCLTCAMLDTLLHACYNLMCQHLVFEMEEYIGHKLPSSKLINH